MVAEPTTLQEAVVYFADPQNCYDYVVPRRWSDGVVLCPTCGSSKVKFQPQHNRWQCSNKHPRRQFTLKTGTVMEDSPIGLDKWLTAMWLMSSNRNGASSWEIHRALKVTQKTAWFLLHRIRLAMQDDSATKLAGTIEADESFFGGKAANMHLDKLTRLKMEGHVRAGTDGKAIVMALLERHGKAKVKVLPNVRAFHVRNNVIENVEKGSTVYTDSLRSYRNLPVDGFIHEFVDHSERYVNGQVHTNSVENFWALMKRTIKGTYVSVEPFHLQAYADEQVFRFNNRLPMNDADRFSNLVRKIVGKRITYKELIGKTEEGTCVEETAF